MSRLQQLHVLTAARVGQGPCALMNDAKGKPDTSTVSLRDAVPGQLLYYFQAVDRFKHDIGGGRAPYIQALKFLNLSKSAGMMGLCGVYLGMRVRLTRKLMSPELVQEATGEVVDVVFDSRERFGHPASSPLRPADTHPCWERGWVRCDYLPKHVAVRFDGCTEDYTGLGLPGVYFLTPASDEWDLPIERTMTIDHPGALRAKTVKVTGKKKNPEAKVTRTQLPLAPAGVGTFQNIQGTTVRAAEGGPIGFDVDLFRPSTMRGEGRDAEYFQHVYMALGRARRLDWMVIRNFPRTEAGALDWSIFERGPPDYLCEFMECLERLSASTLPRLERVPGELGVPAWEDVPRCEKDPRRPGRFLFDARAWAAQAMKGRVDSGRPARFHWGSTVMRRVDSSVASARHERSVAADVDIGDVSSALVLPCVEGVRPNSRRGLHVGRGSFVSGSSSRSSVDVARSFHPAAFLGSSAKQPGRRALSRGDGQTGGTIDVYAALSHGAVGHTGGTRDVAASAVGRTRCAGYDSLSERRVSRGLQRFVGENFSQGFRVSAFEAGGEGDCLFHSVGAGLDRLVDAYPESFVWARLSGAL